MFTIGGVIKGGLGEATRTLALQLPLIANEFPEISNCYRGSINIECEVPLLVVAPDHRTRPIAWNPADPAAEVFDFVRIDLEVPDGASPVPAWLYIPHGSPHRRTPYIHEVITRRLDLGQTTTCRVTINRQAFQLPLPYLPMVLVV